MNAYELETIQKQELGKLTNVEIKKIQNQELGILSEIDRIAKKHNISYYLAYGSAIGAVRHHGFIPWDTDVDIIVDIDSYARLEKLLKSELNPKYKLQNYQTDKRSYLLFSRVILEDQIGVVVHVDVFPVVGAPNGKLKQFLFIKLTRIVNQLFYVKQVNPSVNYEKQKGKRCIAKLLKFILFPLPVRVPIYAYKKLSKMYPIKNAKYLFNLGGTYGFKEIIKKEWLSDPVYVDFENKKLPIPKEYDKYLTHIYGDYMTPIKDN